DTHLRKGVGDIAIVSRAALDDERLTRRRCTASDPVELTRVGTAEDSRQQYIGRDSVAVEGSCVERPTLAGASAHPPRINELLCRISEGRCHSTNSGDVMFEAQCRKSDSDLT